MFQSPQSKNLLPIIMHQLGETIAGALIVAGGGVLYSQAWAALRAFAEAHGVPVVESHGGGAVGQRSRRCRREEESEEAVGRCVPQSAGW